MLVKKSRPNSPRRGTKYTTSFSRLIITYLRSRRAWKKEHGQGKRLSIIGDSDWTRLRSVKREDTHWAPLAFSWNSPISFTTLVQGRFLSPPSLEHAIRLTSACLDRGWLKKAGIVSSCWVPKSVPYPIAPMLLLLSPVHCNWSQL